MTTKTESLLLIAHTIIFFHETSTNLLIPLKFNATTFAMSVRVNK